MVERGGARRAEGVMIIVIVAYIIVEANAYPFEAKCNSNWQCPYPHSYCYVNTHLCVCQPSHPVRLPNGACLPALTLGEKCDYSDSCRFLVENSVCHINKGCTCKDGYRPIRGNPYPRCVLRRDLYGHSYESDEDDSDEDDDDDDDDDRKDLGSDIATPIIVGVVLGSVIVCGWSCAICRMYLRKVESQRTRKRIRRIRRPKSYPRNRDTEALAPNQRQYTLIPAVAAVESSTRTENNTPNFNVATESNQNSDVIVNPRVVPTDSHVIPTLICPDEEPLPGYERYNKDDPDTELPPTYEEVMSESMNSVEKGSNST